MNSWVLTVAEFAWPALEFEVVPEVAVAGEAVLVGVMSMGSGEGVQTLGGDGRGRRGRAGGDFRGLIA